MANPFSIGAEKINDFQTQILDECLEKKNGGLSLPMGSGKTFLSIMVALQLTKDLILVVCSKSLLSSWETEIKKMFGNSLQYEILHSEYTNLVNWKPKKDTRLVITNIDTCVKAYKSFELDQKFIFREPPDGFGPIIVHYIPPKKPYLPNSDGIAFLYSVQWGCLIVDEVQDYTKVTTINCQSLGALCAKYRWLTSGTMFNEPAAERILGYYIILNHPTFPRNLPEAKRLIYSKNYRGIRETTVHRASNEAFQPPKVNKKIITHALSKEEVSLYTMMRKVLIDLNERLKELKRIRAESNDIKKFSSYLLAMLTYLREGLVCPIIPIASVSIDIADLGSKNELAEILMNKIDEMELGDWLNDINSVKSTRIKSVINTCKEHSNGKIVIFSCFRSCLDILEHYLPKDRQVFTISGNMSGPRRGSVIKEFEQSDGGILLLTYKIGGQGLNLQCANTVLLIDYWWNAGITNQAIARVLRFGQKEKTVNIYLFSSNTGVESAVLKKQQTKLAAIEELLVGNQTTEVHRMKMAEIIRLIDVEENKDLLNDIYG